MYANDDVVAIAQVRDKGGLLRCQMWARNASGWSNSASAYRVMYDGEGGTEVSKESANDVIRNWRIESDSQSGFFL